MLHYGYVFHRIHTSGAKGYGPSAGAYSRQHKEETDTPGQGAAYRAECESANRRAGRLPAAGGRLPRGVLSGARPAGDRGRESAT